MPKIPKPKMFPAISGSAVKKPIPKKKGKGC